MMDRQVAEQDSFNPRLYLKTLTNRPGVYRMIDAGGTVIYVGKARNLKKRVSSYFKATPSSTRIGQMVAQINAVEITVTNTENEALILENNLIKEFKPRYNVLLRDDKSYPYLFLSQHDYPRLSYHRGAKREKGRYFGPYPGTGAVRETLNLLQKIFHIRQCEDGFFKNRSRPCLQYQIRRCSAPCVGMIDKQRYHDDIRHAILFLEGKNQQVIDDLITRMEAAAKTLQFELAAQLRDQIASLRQIQERQYITGDKGDIDIIAAVTGNGIGCIEIIFLRGGRIIGNKTFFPRHPKDASAEEILSAFLPQYYLGRESPDELILNLEIDDKELLEQVISESAGHSLTISNRVRGERARWQQMARTNADLSLQQYLSSKANMIQRFYVLQDALSLDNLPQRLECFDISHTAGNETVAACVVFNHEGSLKSDYRRFNIDNITAGDDYAALKQALMRRYKRLKEGEGALPDILFIDGGKGQIKQAVEVLEELQVTGVSIIGIAKGPERKPGEEVLYRSEDNAAIHLPPDSPALHLIQQIRDEAHRFAISGHRQRRNKRQHASPLETIPGLGPRRRRELLKRFGGLQGVARAGVEDLSLAHGISKQLAQRIYDTFHAEEN